MGIVLGFCVEITVGKGDLSIDSIIFADLYICTYANFLYLLIHYLIEVNI